MSADASEPIHSVSRRRVACALALGVIVVWAFVARRTALDGRFGFGWQFLGAFYSTAARNIVEQGPARTRLAMVENTAPASPDHWIVYDHHPPGMALATAALMEGFGDGAHPIQWLGVVFALLQVVVTYALVAEALSPRAGLAAALATAVLPAGAYFSTHGSELGPEAIALALLALWLDERARARDPARPRSWPVLAALAGSITFAWLGLVVAGFIALRDLLGRRFARAATIGAVIPCALGLHALHMSVVAASFTPTVTALERPSLFAALVAHSALGAGGLVQRFTAAQVATRLAGHLRFLFGAPALLLAVAGGTVGLAMARRWAPEGAPARRAWTTLAGLAALALLYSVPLLQAVLVHRYWLIVALPLVAFLIGAGVHATAVRPHLRAAWIVVALAGAAWTTRDVIELQRRDRTPYFEELGGVLRDHVPAGQVVYTTSNDTRATAYYARREIRGGVADRQVDAFVRSGQSDAAATGFFAIVEPPIDPSEPPHAQLAALLEKSWSSTRHRLERTGAEVVLFDLSRRAGR